MTDVFYDQLAPYYHLLYPDWSASIDRQAAGLAAVLAEFGVPPGASVLDAACGIGTQCLGLASRGYAMSASDISAGAVRRAEEEAARRGLRIAFSVADLRSLSAVHARDFDAVIACDNAIPHLLSEAEILRAFHECRACLRPGGVMLISVRDYDSIERKTPDVRPYGKRSDAGREYYAEQEWRWDGDEYDLLIRLIEDAPDAPRRVHEFHSRYWAVSLTTLERLIHEAGFARVERRDSFFFQPLLVGINAS
jgi:SAM-dependent methyltransferase